MKIIELFRKHSFDKIKPSLDHLFVVNCGHHLTEEARSKWKAIYDLWTQKTNPVGSNFHVYLAVRWEYTSPMLDMNCTVCDSAGEILHPLAIHENKAEALGMEVIVENYVDIDVLDLTAGLFWEMTYYPFDNKDILDNPLGRLFGHE